MGCITRPRGQVLVLMCAFLLLWDARAFAQLTAGDAFDQVLRNYSAGSLTGVAPLQFDISVLRAVMSTEASTLPTSSSTGSLTWVFDPSLGVQVRRNPSLGPVFVERAVTNGSHRASVGFTYQRTRFQSIGDQSLDSLTSSSAAVSTFPTIIIVTQSTFTSSVELTLDRFSASANYGITDWLDVGVIVPLVRAAVTGTSNVCSSSAVTPRSAGPGTPAACTPTGAAQVISGSSFGVGDVVVRIKAALPTSRVLETAVGLDVRTASGDRANLLGAGTTQSKVLLIGTKPMGAVAPRFNIGYTFGGQGIDPSLRAAPDVSPEINYTIGTDVMASPRLTFAGDVIGRALRGSATFASGTVSRAIDANALGVVTGLQPIPGNVNLLFGTVNGKVLLGDSWLLTAGVLVPLNNSGLKPKLTPIVGIERAF